MALELTSTAFADHGEIPPEFTADGNDEVPPLEISGVPKSAKTLALVVEDPDAPRAKPFTHWIVYDIPPSTQRLGATLPRGAIQGTNDFGRKGWAGPKPPSGKHRYVFKLYALDTTIPPSGPMSKDDFLARIDG